ncbi:hypothetical protein J6590_071649 [Homalodisca vitripennis]|nr:hypothetical protein J6590_071649 [Homalodisca vitripennis]
MTKQTSSTHQHYNDESLGILKMLLATQDWTQVFETALAEAYDVFLYTLTVSLKKACPLRKSRERPVSSVKHKYDTEARNLKEQFLQAQDRLSLYDFRVRVLEDLLPPEEAPLLITPMCNSMHRLFKLTKRKGNTKSVTRRCRICYQEDKRKETVYYCAVCPDEPAQRYAENFSLPIHTKKLFEKKPSNAGAKFFNQLPEDIKSTRLKGAKT